MIKFLKSANCLLFVFIIFIFISNINAGNFNSNSRRSSFNFDWRFHLGDVIAAENPEFNDSDWRSLNVPHDWSIEGEFSSQNASGTGYLPGGIGWYRKDFILPETDKEKHIEIQFDAVYDNSEVWINGHFLGKRPYGFISFCYDLTPYLNFGNKKN